MSAPFLILLILSLASCTSNAPTSPPPPGSCASLSELQCINSAACTLELTTGSTGVYFCRVAADSCEQDFRQGIDTQAICEEKPGCQFVPGFCYGPPDVTCVCGGGRPPTCTAGSG